MKTTIRARTVAILLSPLLLFVVLFLPYGWLNGHYIVDWLGCGCPRVDEFGNDLRPALNANDFTALFFLFVSVCVTVIAVFLSKRIPREKTWLRVLYVAGMLLVSLLVTSHFYRILMWC